MENMRKIAPWLLGVIGSFVAVTLFGRMTFHIEAFQFELFLELFDHGVTEINIPPLGTISAITHQTPIKIGIILQNLDLDLLRNLLENPPGEKALVELAKTKILGVLVIFAARILFLATIGSMAAMLTLHKIDWKSYLRAGLLGFLVLALMLTGTYLTFDVHNFLSPSYEGILAAAPWMLGLAEEALANMDTLGKQMQLMADNLYTLFSKIETMQVMGSEGDLLLLHVSDIHNNPAAYEFVARVVESFGVDAVIDTGDISDYGTPLEAQLVKRVAGLKVPYLFIGGNHDSPEITAVMEHLENVQVIKNRVIDFKGLKIAGIFDPSASSSEIKPAANESRVMRETENMAWELVWEQGPVDVLMVHNNQLARKLAGSAPLILCGHNHQLAITQEKSSIIVNAGTTGAAGVRGLQTENEIPYTLVLLRFGPTGKGLGLIAADSIKVFNLRSGFTLERKTFTENSRTTGEKETGPQENQ